MTVETEGKLWLRKITLDEVTVHDGADGIVAVWWQGHEGRGFKSESYDQAVRDALLSLNVSLWLKFHDVFPLAEHLFEGACCPLPQWAWDYTDPHGILIANGVLASDGWNFGPYPYPEGTIPSHYYARCNGDLVYEGSNVWALVRKVWEDTYGKAQKSFPHLR